MEQLQTGFSGELPQVHLADVLQLHSQNRFSGGLSVQQQQEKGVIFFREGEVIHAEQDSISGIDAIYRMLSWQGGHFACHPNLKTLQTSIRMSMSQLLLECHRRLDEDGAYRSPETSKTLSMNKTIRKVLPIPGVNFAVLIDDQGHPFDDDSDSAARLSAQGHYFGDIATQLGNLFGARHCHYTAVSGQAGHCLVFHSPKRSMVVAVPGNCDYHPVESAIRATLARK